MVIPTILYIVPMYSTYIVIFIDIFMYLPAPSISTSIVLTFFLEELGYFGELIFANTFMSYVIF